MPGNTPRPDLEGSPFIGRYGVARYPKPIEYLRHGLIGLDRLGDGADALCTPSEPRPEIQEDNSTAQPRDGVA